MARAPDRQQTFTDWMADHRGIVIKIVRSFTERASDADDLTQEIDLAVWRSIPSFRGDAKPSTWIWRIALNRAISWQRAERTGEAGTLRVEHLGGGGSAEPVARERADSSIGINRIFDAIRTLAPIDRSLIVLALEGHRYSEMAEITGLTESNVGARLSRARTHLDALLGPDAANEEAPNAEPLTANSPNADNPRADSPKADNPNDGALQ
ncbi:MAG: RNA polymerase sigma factor [Actinomycetota bacterium]